MPRKLNGFIASLLSSPNVEAAAKAAGVSRATACRWLKDPAVQARLREARKDAMSTAMARLQEAAAGAVDCLCEVQKEGESESARVSAARCVLEQALRAAELGDLEERLAKLETIAQSRSWRSDEPPHAAPKGVNGHA
jgi:phage terminase small subunit